MNNRSRGPETPSDPQPGTDSDWQGLGDLVALATERLTQPVEGIHGAIADRWFGLAGPGVAPLHRGYRAVVAGIYGTVRMAGSTLGTVVGAGAEAARRSGLRPLWRSPSGSGVQAVANALWGDALEQQGSNLRIELGFRDGRGQPIGSDSDDLGRAYPKPTGRLAVMLHGLGETERCWQQTADGDDSAIGLGDVLTLDSFTPLLVRYNTGKHVSDNGRDLATLLEEAVGNWPVPVEEIALIGNSMGGLVVRSSLHAGQADRHRWPLAVQHVVTVGAPHLGAPLEKGVNIAARGLRIAAESRPIGEFLDRRSVGIKDLRFGAVREQDWQGIDPAALFDATIGDAPLPGNVEQHFVAGVVTEKSAHPVGVLVGDLVVRTGSGTGRGRHRTIDATDVRVIGRRLHSDLAGDPTVHQQIRDWLAAPRFVAPDSE